MRDHSKVKIEIPVDGYDAEPWNGVSDYWLYRENGEVLAVVEAKRTLWMSVSQKHNSRITSLKLKNTNLSDRLDF